MSVDGLPPNDVVTVHAPHSLSIHGGAFSFSGTVTLTPADTQSTLTLKT